MKRRAKLKARAARAATTWDRETFAALVRRRGAGAVALDLGVRSRNVQRWAKGEREPDAGARSAIAALMAKAAPTRREDERSPAPPPAATSGEPARSEASSAAVEVLDLRAETIEAIRLHRKELRRLDGDPNASPGDWQKAATSLNTALRLLARLDGAGEITASQILRSPAWRRCSAVIVDVARKYPGCCEALGKAMRELEAEGG